jgi:DNA invertase Pin-like site-specific DNA recombinase
VTDASAIYARASTVEQTCVQQLDRLRVVAPGALEYVDEGVSGCLSSRPALDRLRSDIVAGRVGSVYAVKVDRLGRSVRSVLEFFDLCEAHNVRVVLVDQAIDTSTPMGRFARTSWAAFAELEVDLIRERTRDAMAAIKAGTRRTRTGRPPGRQPRLTPELVAAVVEARRRKPPVPYRILAVRLGIPKGTCRRAFSLASRGLPAFVTPAGSQRPGGEGAPPAR